MFRPSCSGNEVANHLCDEARIHSYELAYRMQTRAAEAVNLDAMLSTLTSEAAALLAQEEAEEGEDFDDDDSGPVDSFEEPGSIEIEPQTGPLELIP